MLGWMFVHRTVGYMKFPRFSPKRSDPATITFPETAISRSVSFDPNIPRRKEPKPPMDEIDRVIASPEYRAEYAINADDAGLIHDLYAEGKHHQLSGSQLLEDAIVQGSVNALAALIEEGARFQQGSDGALSALSDAIYYLQYNDEVYQHALMDAVDVLVVAQLLDQTQLAWLTSALSQISKDSHQEAMEAHLQGILDGTIVPTQQSLADRDVFICPNRAERDQAARDQYFGEQEAREATGLQVIEEGVRAEDYTQPVPTCLQADLVTAKGRVTEAYTQQKAERR